MSRGEIEELFASRPEVRTDPYEQEVRYRAVARLANGRHVYCAFTVRGGLIRPISARYMHAKEAALYDRS